MKKNLLLSSLLLSATFAMANEPLPYAADWKYAEGKFELDGNSGNPGSDHALYDLGGWEGQITAGERNFYIAISKGNPLANTIEFVDNKQTPQQTVYMVSPAFDFSAFSVKTITMKAGIQSATARNTNLELLYSTDFSGDATTATWTSIKGDLIPNTQSGLAENDLENITVNADIQAPTIHIAIKFDKAANADEEATEQTKMRVMSFSITESEKVATVNLPYKSDWRYNSQVMNPVDTTLNFDVDPNIGKYSANQSFYELGGWINEAQEGGRPYFLAKSGDKALINTFEFVDNKQSKPVTNWLISPAFNFSEPGDKYISLMAGKSEITQLSSNLDIVYTTNYTGDVATTEWTMLAEEIVLKDSVGMSEVAMITTEKVLSITADEVVFAIKGRKYLEAGSSQTKIRFRNFVIDYQPIATGVESTTAATAVSVYPNPSKDMFTISAAEEVTNIKMTNIAGSVVMDIAFPGNTIMIDHLNQGIYPAYITLANGEVARVKIIKK